MNKYKHFLFTKSSSTIIQWAAVRMVVVDVEIDVGIVAGTGVGIVGGTVVCVMAVNLVYVGLVQLNDNAFAMGKLSAFLASCKSP